MNPQSIDGWTWRRKEVVRLRPSRKVLVLSVGAWAYLTFGAVVTAIREPSAWSEYGVLAILSVGLLFGIVWRLRRHHFLQLEITDQSITAAGRAITRKEVTKVERHKTLLFDGVRIDLVDGTWLGIRAQHHDPAVLLGVLREQGYPVSGQCGVSNILETLH